MDEVNAKKSKLALIYMAVIMAFVFSGWSAMLTNFTVEEVFFTGSDMGDLQSFREIPGFLAFSAVFVLLFLREQTFAILALVLLCIGVLATGYFPSKYGLIATTVLMSIGFHYFETINSSLSLQWLQKAEAPAFLGKVIGYGSIAALVSYGIIWLFYKTLGFDYVVLFT
ncbi:MAG: MFS transporter, partial [Kordiimonadaceae bacterium]|nr:MFS transporter [Kordiimonadaceae bacterium]